ncbi:MAG TPA: ATP-grasp domain-containing protein [Negativicutes bacterium]|nr:ATP-grasp domain-containing protein [Negativicutes bacterium]
MHQNNSGLPWLDKGMLKDWYGIFSGFSIALEAWRRGLNVTIYDSICSSYEISMPEDYLPGLPGRTLCFRNTRVVDEASDAADRICKDKQHTKELLAKAGVLVPAGRSFGGAATPEEMAEYASKLGFPVVLKPVDGEKGKGVIVGIRDESALLRDLHYVRQELDYKRVIIERHVEGNECRILVVGDQVVGAIRRIPANVVGNGRNTIEELIAIKNRKRRNNPCTSSSLIKVDRQVISCMGKLGHALDSIPEEGEQVFLRENSNVSAGGDPVDVTDNISEAVKRNAVRAVKAIPGLYHAGVDVLLDDSKGEADPGVIIEINSRPMISLHLFPVKGTPRDTAGAIVDLNFPATLGYRSRRQNDRMYFDRSILEPIIKGMASSVTLKSIPLDGLQFCKVMLYGAFSGIGFEKWVQLQAVRNNLSGYVEAVEGERARLVLAGMKGDIKRLLMLLEKGQAGAKPEGIYVKECRTKVFLGFGHALNK